MQYENLTITEEDDILLLAVNRPHALNALNQTTLSELEHFFREDAPARTHIKGIILHGSGDRAFVAGADIKEFLGLDVSKGEALSRRGQDVFALIENFPKPVVAAIHGFALGGGCELAMACHMRVASERARFGQPEVNLGIIPGYGGTQRLVQLVGKGKAMELMLTGDMLDAAEAHRLGLINHVTLPGEELDKAREILHKIAVKAPIAVAKVIDSVNAYFDKSADGYEREIENFGVTAGTSDFKEGASAFIEKRKANFQGQ